MGIDISGGMIVGEDYDSVSFDEILENYEEDMDIYEVLEELEMCSYSKWFDADYSGQVVGFEVEDVIVNSENFDQWVEYVKEKANKFEKITGVKAKLIGMQDVW